MKKFASFSQPILLQLKKIVWLSAFLLFVLGACHKKETPTPASNNQLTAETLILDKDISSSDLVSADSTQLVFNTSSATSKIKIGSVIVSDMNPVAPEGLLRKVVSVSQKDNTIICTTVQAQLTDAVLNGSVSYSKTLSAADILSADSSGQQLFSLNDAPRPGNKSLASFTPSFTIPIQKDFGSLVSIDGSIVISPTFDFQLEIKNGRVTKFVAQLTLNNTNSLNVNAGNAGQDFNAQVTLLTFPLKPFTILIADIPIPIAKQWIEFDVGVSGNLTAKITAGVQNVNTVVAGVQYAGGQWTTSTHVSNSFSYTTPHFEGSANVEPYCAVNYEIRPYGLKDCNIYLGVKGFVDGTATATSSGLTDSLKWGFALNGVAQISIFDNPILAYNHTFFQQEYPIWGASTFAYPTISIKPLSGITQTGASASATISSDGGAPITARGLCWSTQPNPSISNNTTSNGTGTGDFSATISGLTPNTVYYVSAYATNSVGTAYSAPLTFTTAAANPTVTDIDGNIYHTVTIGTQVWMLENLRATHYRNGDPIANITDSLSWINATNGSYCWYNNVAANKNLYGALYNFYSVIDTRNLAPAGWHVATAADIILLENYLGFSDTNGATLAGGLLKEAGTQHWLSPNSGATNSSGFTALPGGNRAFGFAGIGALGYWWLASPVGSTQGDCFSLSSSNGLTAVGGLTNYFGFSVRCIKDN